MTVIPYPELIALETYTLTVTILDASGNSNSSSVDFVIEEEDAASPLPDPSTDPSEPDDSDEKANIDDLFGDPVVQIALLFVVLMILVAFIRTRKHELDYSQPIEDDLFDD